jgi:hypothetical protein
MASLKRPTSYFLLRTWYFGSVVAIAALVVPLTTLCMHAAQPAMHVTGERLEPAFAMPGSDAIGLVVSVTIDQLKGPASTGDFTLFVFDGRGARSGQVRCLAMRFFDGGDPKQPWMLLDTPAGTLARSFRALVDSGAAIVKTERTQPLDRTGRYELAYLIGPAVKQAALTYGDDHPDPTRPLIAKFDVPW